MKRLFLLLISILALSCREKMPDLPKDGLYARFETGKGTIITSLEYDKAPVTVANFVLLAEGKNPFVDKSFKGKPFYDGLTFHRVIHSFMIQGGDPAGDGSGGPGYKFKDEISDLSFDKSGVLAMANAGPATNGSQFFITHVPTPFLNGRHTVFGFVVQGMDVVNRMETDDVIKSVTIIRKGDRAKQFDALKTFSNYVRNAAKEQAEQEVQMAEEKKAFDTKSQALRQANAASLAAMKTKAKKLASGLRYLQLEKGSGAKPKNGTQVFINYAGFLENGTLFDTNMTDVAKDNGSYNPHWARSGKYTPISFQIGKKQGMIPGFIEALEKMSFGEKAVVFIPSHLGYGPQGAGGVIPPNADLVFKLELLEKPN